MSPQTARPLVPSITITLELSADDERAEVAAAAIRELAADIAENHGVALRVELREREQAR